MGFFSSLWGKNSENGKNTQNNTPTVQQPRMTEAQRHGGKSGGGHGPGGGGHGGHGGGGHDHGGR